MIKLACIDTSGVCVPNVCPHARKRLAGGHIDELVVRNNTDALLIVGQIRANVFAQHVEWAHFTLRVEDGAGIVSEDLLREVS